MKCKRGVYAISASAALNFRPREMRNNYEGLDTRTEAFNCIELSIPVLWRRNRKGLTWKEKVTSTKASQSELNCMMAEGFKKKTKRTNDEKHF